MTAIVETVSQRVWVYPSAAERVTWAVMYDKIRSATGLYAEAALPTYRLTEAVNREIERLSTTLHCEEVWECSIDSAIDYIALPWQPTQILDVSWRTDDRSTWGTSINPGFWQVWEAQWRWLPPDTLWPTGTILWRMQALGRPRTTALEATYCTVMPEILVPLVLVELDRLTALERGGEPIQVNQASEIRRDGILKGVPKRRIPPHRPKTLINTNTTVIFKNWGQDEITFADLT